MSEAPMSRARARATIARHDPLLAIALDCFDPIPPCDHTAGPLIRFGEPGEFCICGEPWERVAAW